MREYKVLESGQPLLYGHIFYKMFETRWSIQKICDWATLEKAKNDLPPVHRSKIAKLSLIYKKRNAGAFSAFVEQCKWVVPSVSVVSTKSSVDLTASSSLTATTTQSSTTTQYSVATQCSIKTLSSTETRRSVKLKELKEQLTCKNKQIRALKRKLKYQERKEIENYNEESIGRKLHYDCLLNGLPVVHVPELVAAILKTLKINQNMINTSSTNTVYRMVGELGFFSDIKTVNAILNAEDCTLIFDATTQDGIHVNCVLLTTPSSSHLVSLEHVAGGTAEDYKQHICNSINNLAKIYSLMSGLSFDECLKKILSKIKCCLTDRAPVNHLTVVMLEKEWQINIIELNCNLHPLEAISSRIKKELTVCESPNIKNIVNGDECLAWKIIMAMNSIRYSDELGYINAMKSFFKQEGFPVSLIPRFRGNRLHIIFHLGAIYFTYYEKFKTFLQGLSGTNETLVKLKRLFQEETAIVELQVLGIMGKMLSGPWMSTFYTDLNTQKHPIDTMQTVKDVIANLKIQLQAPMDILLAQKDFFGKILPAKDIEYLLISPPNITLFAKMITACLKGTVEVLNRQYEKSFTTVEASSVSVLTSARQHTMLAESIIGEFCEKKKHAPNAYVSSISDIIKAKRNKVKEFIDELDADQFQKYLKLALYCSRKKIEGRKKEKEVKEAEIAQRFRKKRSKEEAKRRTKLQKSLEKLNDVSIPSLKKQFPDLTENFVENLHNILTGEVVGHVIKHVWTIDGLNHEFIGFITDFSNPYYEIYYLSDNNVEEGCQLAKYQVGTDYILEDLSFEQKCTTE